MLHHTFKQRIREFKSNPEKRIEKIRAELEEVLERLEQIEDTTELVVR